MEIFLSYCWADKSIADELDQDWSQLSLKVVRDIRDLEFKQDLKEFMQKITKTDYVITLISESYLKSKNCMHEALELMTDSKFNKKIIPIVVNGTKLHSPSFRIDLINYWDNQVKELQEKIRDVSTLSATSNIIQELKEIESVRNDIDDFIKIVNDQKYSSWEDARRTNYSEIFKYLGLEHSEVFEQAIAISKIKDSDKRNLELEKSLVKNPENIALQTLKAVLITEEGKYELGKVLFSTLLEKYPNQNIFKYNLAVIEDKYFKNWQVAELLYSEILTNSLNYTDARVNLAIIWIETARNFDKARDHLQLSLYSNPEPARALYSLGQLYSNHYKNDKEALKYLNWAVQVEPNFQEAITLKALIEYSDNSDLSLLIATLKSCVEIDSFNSYTLLVLGGQLFKDVKTKQDGLGYIKQAKEILENNIKNNPHDYNSRIPLAYILKQYYSENEKADKLYKEGLSKRKDLENFEL